MCLITQACNLWLVANGQPLFGSWDLFVFSVPWPSRPRSLVLLGVSLSPEQSVRLLLLSEPSQTHAALTAMTNTLFYSLLLQKVPVVIDSELWSKLLAGLSKILEMECCKWKAFGPPPSGSLVSEGCVVYSMLPLCGSNKVGWRTGDESPSFSPSPLTSWT